MPKKRAMTTPRTDAQTEVAPLIPQRNAVGAPGLAEATRIPIGNGMPIRSPRGMRIATAVAIRAGVVAPAMLASTLGVTIPNAAMTTRRTARGASIQLRRPAPASRSLAMLPIPLKTSNEKSTTVSAYVGWPRKIVSR